MRLDASTAEIVQFLQKQGYRVHFPVDAEISDEQARIAVGGNRYVIVTRTSSGLAAEYDAGPEMKGIRERLAERPSALNLTDEQAAAVAKAFADNSWDGLYLFYDGSIKPDSWAKTLSSRLAALVSIATEGIPIHISRTGFEKWQRDTGWKPTP